MNSDTPNTSPRHAFVNSEKMAALVEAMQVQFNNLAVDLNAFAPRILIVGPSGVGKSTLVNNMFRLDGEEAAVVRAGGTPCTSGFTEYGPFENCPVRLVDSKGIERLQADSQRREICNFIREKKIHSPVEDQVHITWYVAASRWEESDTEYVSVLRELVPVIVVVSKCDTDERNQIDPETGLPAKETLKASILRNFDDINIIFCGDPSKKTTGWEPNECSYGHSSSNFIVNNRTRKWKCQAPMNSTRRGVCDDSGDGDSRLSGYMSLSKCTSELIPAVIQTSFMHAQMVDIETKNELAVRVICRNVALMTGVAAVPLPFADVAPLLAIEGMMAAELFKVYQIPSSAMNVGSFITINTVLIGSFGVLSKVCAQFLKGTVVLTVAGSALDVVVAAVSGTALGISIAKVCAALAVEMSGETGGFNTTSFVNRTIKEIQQLDFAQVAPAVLSALSGQGDLALSRMLSTRID